MEKQVYKRYSEAFRIQVIREYEAGATISSLQKKYGIKGMTTIPRWIKKYSLQGIRHQMMIIQTPEEQDQMKALEERNKQLEKLVAQLSLDKLMLESTLAVIKRDYGVDVKKNEPKSSKRPTNGGVQGQ